MELKPNAQRQIFENLSFVVIHVNFFPLSYITENVIRVVFILV